MGRWGHTEASWNVKRRLKGPAWRACPIGGWRLEKGEGQATVGRLGGEETLLGAGPRDIQEQRC